MVLNSFLTKNRQKRVKTKLTLARFLQQVSCIKWIFVYNGIGLSSADKPMVKYRQVGNVIEQYAVAAPLPAELSTEEIAQNRINELNVYLDTTDWYVVRFAETGVAIPPEISQARAAARLEISTLRGETSDV